MTMKTLFTAAAALMLAGNTVYAGDKHDSPNVEVKVEVVKKGDKAHKETKVYVDGKEIDPNDEEAMKALPKGTKIMIKEAGEHDKMHWVMAGDKHCEHKECKHMQGEHMKGEHKHRHHKVIELKVAGENAPFDAVMSLIKDGNFTDEQRAQLIKALKNKG
jgi:hypothetical protein